MGDNKKCSRDDCPRANVHKDYMAKCGNCGAETHLPCIGIDYTVNVVLFHPSIRVFCNICAATNTKGAVQPVLKPSSFVPAGLASVCTSNSQKIDKLGELLNEVHDIVSITKEKVMSDIMSPISYADVVNKVDELKEIANMANNRVNENQTGLSSTDNPEFPALGERPHKRKFVSSPQPKSIQPQRKFFSRKLASGTAADTNHALGAPVAPVNGNIAPRFTKAVYVSRMQNTVTKEQITEYIKSQINNVNENEFSLRLLVKKDVDVRTRRFISYRLACTEALYATFMEPSFWPKHIEIGEFIEESRDRGSDDMASFSSPFTNGIRRFAKARNTTPFDFLSKTPSELLSALTSSTTSTTAIPSAASKNDATVEMVQ